MKIENNSPSQSSFSNKDVQNALSWTKNLVDETGTRLTGTSGCRKASEIIYHKLQELCPVVNKQEFTHHRDAFLSVPRMMSLSYIVALMGLWWGGMGNYIAAIIMLFATVATLLEFVFYKEFLDPLFSKTNSSNIIGRIEPKEERQQTLIFSAHYDSPYVFHYLQNFQKNYIIILSMTLLIYFFGVFLSIIAAVYQIQDPVQFVYGISWKYL